MVDALASPPEPRAPTALKKPQAAAGFSYAAAAASLEKNAGASLKAFGGKPETAPVGAPREGSRAEERAAPARANAPRTEPQAHAVKKAPETGEAHPGPVPSVPSPAAGSTAPAPPEKMIAPGVGGLAAAAKSIATLATRGVPEAAAGKAEPARAQIDLKTVKPAAAPPVRTTEDFARLIARRLDDGSSEFELRLDPPELGRIEARLIVGDDGEATLAIKFDNQAAYDLFARDDAALRLAFAEAGYDFGRSGLSFSLDDRPRPETPANVAASPPDAVQRASYVALVAANALDLRV